MTGSLIPVFHGDSASRMTKEDRQDIYPNGLFYVVPGGLLAAILKTSLKCYDEICDAKKDKHDFEDLKVKH